MTNIDQFESVFRSALREGYQYRDIRFKSALLVTDLSPADSQTFMLEVRRYLDQAPALVGGQWNLLCGSDFRSTQELLGLVEQSGADLICTYRNLHSSAWKFPHSLGEHLDVLLQLTSAPVLVFPHPEAEYRQKNEVYGTQRVMAMTHHLADDYGLVDHAVAFTSLAGTLSLVHVEDGPTFDRYMRAISKIPAIDTADAETRIRAQLLKEPVNYIESCRRELTRVGLQLQVREMVTFGHHLSEYRRLVMDQQAQLLVMHTKDSEQLAMHGLAYPLAIELRQIPILML